MVSTDVSTPGADETERSMFSAKGHPAWAHCSLGQKGYDKEVYCSLNTFDADGRRITVNVIRWRLVQLGSGDLVRE